MSLSNTHYPVLSTGPEVINLVPCSTQLSMKLILLMNVKNANNCWHFITSEGLKARIIFICLYFSFYEQLNFHAQLS